MLLFAAPWVLDGVDYFDERICTNYISGDGEDFTGISKTRI
jgi:hypothetical protein